MTLLKDIRSSNEYRAGMNRFFARSFSYFALAISFVALAVPVRAATPAKTIYDSCMAKAVSTADMSLCQSAEVHRLDGRVAAVLAKVLAALPADQAAKLRASQRLWTTFRQSDCEVFYGNETGTIATINGGDCVISRTKDRIKDLQAFLPEQH
jgi:uncharacterized protein YecT (DUF1311 family)